MFYFRSCVFKDPKASPKPSAFATAKGKDKSTAKHAGQRRNAYRRLKQTFSLLRRTTGRLISWLADSGIVLDKYFWKHLRNLKNEIEKTDSQCNVSFKGKASLEIRLQFVSYGLWKDYSSSRSIFCRQTKMCFRSGQSWGDVDQLWSKRSVGRSKQREAWAKKLSLLPGLLAWVQCMHKCKRGFWTGAVCILPVCLEEVGLSAKSTLVNPKLL